MGMYTGLRLKAKVKEAYKPLINDLMNEGIRWADLSTSKGFIADFASYSRANFIPFGSLAYMPDEWEQAPYGEYGEGVPTDGFHSQFDTETGFWAFQCSLKNYDSTIEYFFEHVLCHLVEDVHHLEYYYEEWASSTLYELQDGKIVESDKPGIVYEEEDSAFWGYHL